MSVLWPFADYANPTMTHLLRRLATLSALLLPAVLPAQTNTAADPIGKIKDEGMNRSQVMATLSHLTDVIGPRLTGTPALKKANEWTRDELTKFGLSNAHLEPWGPFGRGWTLQSFTAEMSEPQVRPLEAFPKAWSPNVDVKNAEVVWVNAKAVADLQKYKGQLRGKVVMSDPLAEVNPHFKPEAERVEDSVLAKKAAAKTSDGGNYGMPTQTPDGQARLRRRMQTAAFGAARARFFMDEGVALILDASRAGDGGNIFVQQASVPATVDTSSVEAFRASYAKNVKPWDKSAPVIIPQLAVAVEQYNRLARMIEKGEKPKVSIHLAVQYHAEDMNAYNTIAELPGTDKKDQVVMLGGHLDSWHGGTGATDNACGVAVCMEAVRILKACGLQPRRTIRVALWTGEEQGLYGSEAYVKQHFGDADTAKAYKDAKPKRVITKPEWAKLDAYYNLDNGAGKIRGIYLQGNEAARPIFQPWLAPFKDMGAATVTLENTGGTDHLSFDDIGLPGFQFIQDDLEYFSRTHHSTQDVFDRAPTADMKQASILMAAFIYNTAMRDEPIPRKPVTAVKAGRKKGA